MPRGHDGQRPLTAKEELIVDALRRVTRPLSAYDIIELLRSEGVASPPTVYRALKRLTEAGLAHRIESLNAFVCCAHGGHTERAAFAICGGCGTVAEFHQDAVVELLTRWAGCSDFRIDKMTIELLGRCRDCASEPATGRGS